MSPVTKQSPALFDNYTPFIVKIGRCMDKSNFKGWITNNGYRLIRTPDGRYITEHRYVMELHIGRPLTKDEIVHHRNHDQLDNRRENLELTSQQEHSRMHCIEANKAARMHEANRLPSGRWSIQHECCQRCGTSSRGHAARGLCRSCFITENRNGNLSKYKKLSAPRPKLADR